MCFGIPSCCCAPIPNFVSLFFFSAGLRLEFPGPVKLDWLFSSIHIFFCRGAQKVAKQSPQKVAQKSPKVSQTFWPKVLACSGQTSPLLFNVATKPKRSLLGSRLARWLSSWTTLRAASTAPSMKP